MRTMIHTMMAIALLFVVCERPASAQAAAEGSCPLSTFKDGQKVSVHGRVAYGAHDLLLVIPSCDRTVVLEYAGGPESGESSNKLVRDKNYRRFEKYTRAMYPKVGGKGICIQCPKYEVEATLTGKLDVAADAIPEGLWKDELGMLHDQSGKLVGKAGFGHPPAQKYRLLIESVSDVTARKLPEPK
jgi:hypothetical protein